MFIKKEFFKDLEKAHQLNMVSDEVYIIAKATILDDENNEFNCEEIVNA